MSHLGTHEARQLWASLSCRNHICIKDNYSFHLFKFLSIFLSGNLENVNEKAVDGLLAL